MAKLSEICTINMGQSPESTTYNENGEGLPFFQGNADFGKIHPNVRVWCNAPKKIAHKNDILISVRAPIGALNVADSDCCIGRGLASLSVNNSVSVAEYIWYALESKVDYLISMGTGSTFKAIGKNILFDLDIPLPPLEIQSQIAANLDKVTHTIDLCNAILEKLDLLVKSRFVEMFGDTEVNSNNHPVHKLSDLCTVSSSKRIYQEEQSSSGVPFLRISNLVELIDNGRFGSDLFIPEEKYNELFTNGLVPKADDILVTSRGTLGKCYIIQEHDKFYFQDGMISWLYDIDKSITPLYLTLLFDTRDIKRQIDNLQSGSTVAYLSIAMLKKLNIVVPPLALQQQFAAFVEQTDKSKLAVKQVLEKAETLKKALMQEYFG